MLRPIESYVNVWRSIKKFFIDSLETTEGLTIYFERERVDSHVVDASKVKSWVVVDANDVTQFGNMTSHNISLYLHTRDDVEAEELALLRDKVFDHIITVNDTDQHVRLELFDTSGSPWISMGHALIYVNEESQVYYAEDGTLFKIISITVKWAS